MFNKMKTYIKNLEELAEITGYENIDGENIGYGEKAAVFTESDSKDLFEFMVNGEIGTYFTYENKDLCKVVDVNGDAIIVYSEDGHVYTF